MKTSPSTQSSKYLIIPLVAVIGTVLAFAEGPQQLHAPPGLILTWQQDPTTTITIDWHRLPEESESPAVIQARPRGSQAWKDHAANRSPFPHSDRLIDRVEITGLQPATEYEFRGSPTSKTYWFRTMPASLENPLIFANGGDIMHKPEWMEETNRMVMKHNPEFVVWGGDLAYEDADPRKISRLYSFLDTMVKSLVTDEGRVPPVVVCIGNHEVQGYYKGRLVKSHEDRLKYAPFFYPLFAFPGEPGYRALDFGNYLSLIIGDSDHTNTVAGAQTEWLRETIAARSAIPHVIPVYHVPAWPSGRPLHHGTNRSIRAHWVPIFEQYGIRLAFENHDHAYKRTVPIFDGKEDREKGIIYMGDGSWGVSTRKVHSAEDTWYLEKAQSVRHAMIVTLHKDRKEIDVYTPEGEKIDSLTIPAR